MKKIIAILILTPIMIGLISLSFNIQWQPLFVIKQKEIIKERVYESVPIEVEKVIEKEVVKTETKRIGENYTAVDKQLLTFCIQAGQEKIQSQKRFEWNYWEKQESNLLSLKTKLQNDKLTN